MKAIILFSIFSIISLITLAQETQNLSGFKINESNDIYIKLQFREEPEFIISKAKFKNKVESEAFCESLNLKLDKNGIDTALLLAMSGAAKENDEIKSAISYRLKIAAYPEKSGIWAWDSESLEDSIVIIENGRGTATQKIPLVALKQGLEQLHRKIEIALPAICK